jgi:hypothetical protein
MRPLRRALYRASKVTLAEQDNRRDDRCLLRSLPFPRIGVGMSGLNACLRWEPCVGMCVNTTRLTKKWRMALNEHDLNEQIQKRAYELWEHAGRPDGRHDEMWHRARTEIEAGSHSETSTPAGPANADPEPTELPARMQRSAA